jgi:hypothetical protein
MPNLTSATGSWIVRFAGLKQSDYKVASLLLYQFRKSIRRNPADAPDKRRGHGDAVGRNSRRMVPSAESNVLKSIDPRLDEAAERALSRWQFRPGTKNGDPVELEAVVMIPFQVSRAIIRNQLSCDSSRFLRHRPFVERLSEPIYPKPRTSLQRGLPG